MKKDIHPEYREITVTMTNGETFKTRSTYAGGDSLRLDIDPHTHPAWTGGNQRVNEGGGQMARFNSKFGNFGLGTKK